jgi:DNA-directed RNA polymerase specialized sigma24 family protein
VPGDRARADDVVQDVHLQAWLFKILFHTINHYRRKWLNIRMVKESEEILEMAAAGDRPVPEYITDAAQLAALEPQDSRSAVLLVHVEESAYKDVAVILESTIGPGLEKARGR